MMMALTNPTPIPAIRRPTTRTETADEATWRIAPTIIIPQPDIIVMRRPIQSARDLAKSAPKKVPADKIETMRDFSHVW